MKKRYGVILGIALLWCCCLPICARTADKTVVALGADLSAEQRKTVLELLQLTEESLAECTVITITNQMEHEYLDSYMDPSVIGTKSLSSVKLVPGEKGSGVLVDSRNINYCTTGMYRNALLTAGLEDTHVTVAAPIPISGTAALIGAVKAYEMVSGESITDKTVDTAMDELIMTGEIARDSEQSDEVEQLIAFLKAKLAAGELDDEESIRHAIAEGEDKFGVKLEESEIQRILAVLQKMKALGLDLNKMVDQAKDLYEKFGTDIVNHPDEAIEYAAKKKVGDFFSGLAEKVKSFFGGLFANGSK